MGPRRDTHGCESGRGEGGGAQKADKIPVGDDRPYYVIVPQVVYQVMMEAEHTKYKGFKQPVRRALRAWCGIPRSGTDFICTFGRCLQLLRWLRVPEEPALFVFWQVEDQVAVA